MRRTFSFGHQNPNVRNVVTFLKTISSYLYAFSYSLNYLHKLPASNFEAQKYVTLTFIYSTNLQNFIKIMEHHFLNISH